MSCLPMGSAGLSKTIPHVLMLLSAWLSPPPPNTPIAPYLAKCFVLYKRRAGGCWHSRSEQPSEASAISYIWRKVTVTAHGDPCSIFGHRDLGQMHPEAQGWVLGSSFPETLPWVSNWCMGLDISHRAWDFSLHFLNHTYRFAYLCLKPTGWYKCRVSPNSGASASLIPVKPMHSKNVITSYIIK